jgi:hypothetical protein
MADVPIKIGALVDGNKPLQGDELFPCTQNGFTVKVDAAEVAASAPDISNTVIIFVSQANGNDSNDGLTALAALATAQPYIDAHAAGPAWPVIFKFDSGNHVGPVFPAGWGLRSPVWMFGDGAGQVGDDGFVETRAAEASLAGSTEEIIVTSGSVTNAFVSNTLEVTSGVAVGAMRHINRVNGDDLYVGRAIAGFVPGDTFRIVRAGALLQYSGTDDFIIADGIGSRDNGQGPAGKAPFRRCIGFVNIRLDFPLGAPLGPTIADSTILAFGLEVSGNSGLCLGGASVYAAARFSPLGTPYEDALPFIALADAGNPVDESALDLRWVGWGLAKVDTSFIVLSDFMGWLTQPPAGFAVFRESGRSHVQGGSGGVQAIGACEVLVGVLGSWYALDSADSNGTFWADGPGAMIRISLDAGSAVVDAVNSAGPALLASKGAQVEVDDGSYRSTLAHAGIAKTGSQILVGGAALVVEGSNPGVNDFSNDSGVDIATASLVLGTPFTFGRSNIERES